MPELDSEKGMPFPEKTGEHVDLDSVELTDDSGDSGDQAEERSISQKELDRILQKRLKRQEDAFKKQFADFDKYKAEAEEFRKLQGEKSTDSERWEREKADYVAKIAAHEDQLNKLQRVNLIADLATERGLPKSMWKRVHGDTEEEIAEDIDAMIHDLGPQGGSKDTSTSRKGKVFGGGGESEDPEPDVAKLVASIPRGTQPRVDKPRIYSR